MAQDPTQSIATKKLNAVIQTRHDTSTNMASKVYEGGELFYETDTKKLKIGDGIQQASSLEALNYTKPSTGIPKSDLASDVQTSLEKADTALQSHQSIKTLNTSATSSQAVNTSETIAGSGSITLHRVSKTGEFQHLRDRGESFLEWGGTNLINSNVSPVDAALISELGANRLAFAPAAGITVEYSRDSGTTWVDYGATEGQKLGLTTNGTSLRCGGSDVVAPPDAQRMLRITFSSVAAKVYTVFRKFAIYIGTNGSSGSYVTLRCRTHANVKNNVDTWTTFVDKQNIAGNTGWNIINTAFITYSNTDSQYEEFQFIFGYTGIGDSSYKGLEITRILGFGGAGWRTPSHMAATGHLYSYNTNQSATFPANVTAYRLISNAADGTAPLTVSSSTLVSNLNSDFLDGHQGSYYLNYNNFTNTPTLVNKVSVTGSGNAVTTGSVSGDTITLTKGSTFAGLGANTFTDTQLIGNENVNGTMISAGNLSVRVGGERADFTYGEIGWSRNNNAYELFFPEKTGTIATEENLPKALSITIY